MWIWRTLARIDLRILLIISVLMGVSLLVISSMTSGFVPLEEEGLFSTYVKKQFQFFCLGWLFFFFFSLIDYNRLKEWTWIFYLGMLILLVGLFFVPSVQNVHRWYRMGPFALQPSEYAKLIVVIALSWFLDRKGERSRNFSSAVQALLVVGIPFLLIYKQPDLGTALVLCPITLGLFYFGGIKRSVLIGMGVLALVTLLCVATIFSGLVSHEAFRPYATKVVKGYQYERLSSDTYHQKAAITAIALGGLTGSGWDKGIYSKRQFLPAAHTDSVFPAFAEEFGLLGVIFLLGIFYGLVYVSFQVAVVAKDPFGQLLSAGIAIYIAMHVLVNLGMMCGFLPITGVPLPMISYGGSSVLVTMSALGILQSIYSRRFVF